MFLQTVLFQTKIIIISQMSKKTTAIMSNTMAGGYEDMFMY